MKYLLSSFIICFLCAASGVQDHQGYKVTGKLKNFSASYIQLQYDANGKRVTDSVKVDNGKFTFTGTVEQPQLAYIRSDVDQPFSKRFYLENTTIEISGTTHSITFKGSPITKDYETLQKQLEPVRKDLVPLTKAFFKVIETQKGEKKEKTIQDYAAAAAKNRKKKRRIKIAFIEQHPHSYLSLTLFEDMNLVRSTSYKKLQHLFDAFDPAVQETALGKSVAHRLDIISETAAGQLAPYFTQNNVNGEPVSLKSFRGQYVLLDFWASWCGPCRLENPHVVDAYNKYKDENFTVLSVSLDKSKKKWVKAIKEDGLTWTHVSDLKYWQNAVAKRYNIRAVPSNFLIDPDGIIIARNLRGEELQEKLEQVLGQS